MASGAGEQNRSTAATVLGFPVHPGRSAALGEVHARPAPLVETPHLLVQLAFMTEGGATVDHAVLSDLSRANGVAPPDRGARHHTIPVRLGRCDGART